MNPTESMKIGDVKKDLNRPVKYRWMVKCFHGIESFRTKRAAIAFAEEYREVNRDLLNPGAKVVPCVKCGSFIIRFSTRDPRCRKCGGRKI